jgi:hypothetical protein
MRSADKLYVLNVITAHIYCWQRCRKIQQFNFMKGDLKHLTPLTTGIVSGNLRRFSNIPRVLKPKSEYKACYFPFPSTCIMDPPLQFGAGWWNYMDTNVNILNLVLSVSDTTLCFTTRSCVHFYALDR